jgi:hypothetical protein
MTALIVVQQGGILAGVAQTLAAAAPVTPAGAVWKRVHDEAAGARIAEATARRGGDPAQAAELHGRLAELEKQAAGLAAPIDDTVWAVVVAAATSVLLAVGRYAVVEWVAVLLVGTFTVVTLTALALLQADPAWAISGRELAGGLVPSLPPVAGGRLPLQTALATCGIIGVGASELMFYPYWCLEKGYGRAVGPRDDSPAWAERARGWIRVLALDAWVSMAVYTTVTIAFYLLGAATLGRLGLRPAGGEMVRSLGAMYAPVFGAWAQGLFLTGAFAVLYSTLFAAADGNTRILADGLVLAGAVPDDELSRRKWTRRLAVAWPQAALVMALVFREPVAMVLASGAAQAIMLAALAVAVLFFRYRAVDSRLVPAPAADVLLWLSCAGLVAIGGWALCQKLSEILTAGA